MRKLLIIFLKISVLENKSLSNGYTINISISIFLEVFMRNLRTDLAVESIYTHSGDGIQQETENVSDKIKVTRIEITNESAQKEVGKPMGKYITIENTYNSTDTTEIHNLSIALKNELYKLIPKEKKRFLICGLGNRNITPDALGPCAVDGLMITNHIINILNNDKSADFSSVSAITPGVMGITGIETVDIIKGVTDFHKPDMVIIIDALCAINQKRMFNTVQLTDSGINPGAGVGNRREGINKDTLGVPVIAIGVPTVVDADSIIYDAIYSFFEKNNSKDEAENIINAILKDRKSLFVSPKDIDKLIKKSAKIISDGINLALHKDIDFQFIENYIS